MEDYYCPLNASNKFDIEEQQIIKNSEKMKNLRKHVLLYFKYFLTFEFVCNLCLIITIMVLLANDKYLAPYVIPFFVTYLIKSLLNLILVEYQDKSVFEQNINNNFHAININTSICALIAFSILLGYGSYLTQNETVCTYYFCKGVNINIIFSEFIKVMGLFASNCIEDYNGYDGYVWFVLL